MTGRGEELSSVERHIMHILILHDGRAGHSSQSRAVAMALGKSFTVQETRVFCKLRIGAFQKPLRFLLNITDTKLPQCLFHLFHKGEHLPTEVPDLIISAGGGTVYANAWLARNHGRPNLFCGELRGLNPQLFRAVITGFKKYQGKKPYIISPTPVPVDKTSLARAALAFRARSGIGDARCWSLLVGGDGAGYVYTNEDWKFLAAGMKTLAEKYRIRWLVTTSRRSGKAVEDTISSLIEDVSVAGAHYVSRSESDVSYQEILGTAERHFCTEDSHMMISEAIASGRPVHALYPKHSNTNPSNQYFLDIYMGKGWLCRHAVRDLSYIDFHMVPHPSTENQFVMDELSALLEGWWNSLPLPLPTNHEPK